MKTRAAIQWMMFTLGVLLGFVIVSLGYILFGGWGAIAAFFANGLLAVHLVSGGEDDE